MDNVSMQPRDPTTMDWCDVELCAVSWTNGGRDLQLDFVAVGNPAEESQRILIARWISGLRVNLAFERTTAGRPLSWDAVFRHEPGGRWIVEIDFASHGVLRFECTELLLRVEDRSE